MMSARLGLNEFSAFSVVSGLSGSGVVEPLSALMGAEVADGYRDGPSVAAEWIRRLIWSALPPKLSSSPTWKPVAFR